MTSSERAKDDSGSGSSTTGDVDDVGMSALLCDSSASRYDRSIGGTKVDAKHTIDDNELRTQKGKLDLKTEKNNSHSVQYIKNKDLKKITMTFFC